MNNSDKDMQKKLMIITVIGLAIICMASFMILKDKKNDQQRENFQAESSYLTK